MLASPRILSINFTGDTLSISKANDLFEAPTSGERYFPAGTYGASFSGTGHLLITVRSPPEAIL